MLVLRNLVMHHSLEFIQNVVKKEIIQREALRSETPSRSKESDSKEGTWTLKYPRFTALLSRKAPDSALVNQELESEATEDTG